MDHAREAPDRFYIVATQTRADERTRVLKQDETFAVFDALGDVRAGGVGEQGLYAHGTRFLSRYELRIGQQRPLLLSSTIRRDSQVLSVDLANPDAEVDGTIVLPKNTLHLQRSKFLWDAACYEWVCLWNYGLGRVSTTLTLAFDADFADVFEVRGTHRERRGRRLEPRVGSAGARIGYEGLDGVRRYLHVACSPTPQSIASQLARFDVTLDPGQSADYYIVAACEEQRHAATETAGVRQLPTYSEAVTLARKAQGAADAPRVSVSSSSEPFDNWIARSFSDVDMMVATTEAGPYPYAGVPWFSCPFGRDGIITALELLWADPRLARGVLDFLARTQATTVDESRDAQPGKILHEMRLGEMAALGEVPFGRYYGSVDATPLFVMLAGDYYARTGDRGFVESLYPSIEAAIRWIDDFGDVDGDGFVEYARQSSNGLVQQGWKDSQDSVFHEDGSLAEPPIALCEVQGYVFAARQRAAQLADLLGRADDALRLRQQAEALRAAFDREFWCEPLGTYALALDGAKRPCRVRASNAGHALYTRIARPDRAGRVAETLLKPESFSGWGVRTVTVGERRYNPMSYHNGSVWPHDNALVAAGLGRYGLKEAAQRIFCAMFDASAFLDLHRMPELFCGFPRRPGDGPTSYPTACSPQAWAAAAPLLLLAAVLGLTIDVPRRRVTFYRPSLPATLQCVRLDGLAVGQARLDLVCEAREGSVSVTVLKRTGDVTVVTIT